MVIWFLNLKLLELGIYNEMYFYYYLKAPLENPNSKQVIIMELI